MSRRYTLVQRLPAYFLFEKCTLGSVSLTTKDERYIINEFAINAHGEIETPSHHFSQICKTITFPKKNCPDDKISYPYKFIPCRIPYAFYLDISKAFAQIASAIGMECQYREGRYMAFGSTIPEQLFNESKMMRALLVSGTGKMSSMQTWSNHELSRHEFYNRNFAPYLRQAIIKTLHAVQAMVSRYSVYAHTDGFIIPYWHFSRVCKLLDERRLHYSIKGEGITEIYGHGSYRIGDKHTKIYNHRQKEKTYIDNSFEKFWLDSYVRGLELRQ